MSYGPALSSNWYRGPAGINTGERQLSLAAANMCGAAQRTSNWLPQSRRKMPGPTCVTAAVPADYVWSNMRDLLELGARAGALLKQRRETVVVGETSSGGLIAASLLAVPGASGFFVGGAVAYSARSIKALTGISIEEMLASGIRSSSGPYALLLATKIRARHGPTSWGLAETGAAGPAGNSYGDPPGHTCMAVVGPVSVTGTIRTGLSDRVSNMWAFAEATLNLFVEVLESTPHSLPPRA